MFCFVHRECIKQCRWRLRLIKNPFYNETQLKRAKRNGEAVTTKFPQRLTVVPSSRVSVNRSAPAFPDGSSVGSGPNGSPPVTRSLHSTFPDSPAHSSAQSAGSVARAHCKQLCGHF